jgi:hypothetical protein
MTTLRFDELGIDESPPTIAYVLLAMLSAMYDFEIQAQDDGLRDGSIKIIDSMSDDVVTELIVSPVMGELMIAILTTIGQEMADAVGGMTWDSKI